MIRVIATLRAQLPNDPLHRLCDMIVWSELRMVDETYEHYQNRLHGPMEPL